MDEQSKRYLLSQIKAISRSDWEPVFSDSRFESKFRSRTRKGAVIVLEMQYNYSENGPSTSYYGVTIDGEGIYGESDYRPGFFSRGSELEALYDRLYRHHKVATRDKKHRADYEAKQRQDEADKFRDKLTGKF